MIRGQVRGLIEEMVRGELDATFARLRHGRRGEQPEGGDRQQLLRAIGMAIGFDR